MSGLSIAELPAGKWFHPSEFRCKDGTPYPVAWIARWIRVRDLCDVARELWGGPLIVVSGYRTPEHNNKLIRDDELKGAHGVASGSYHLTGDAADLRTKQGAVDVPQLKRVLLNAYDDDRVILGHRIRALLGGIGDYPVSGWLHIDTHMAADGHLRRWRGV